MSESVGQDMASQEFFVEVTRRTYENETRSFRNGEPKFSGDPRTHDDSYVFFPGSRQRFQGSGRGILL